MFPQCRDGQGRQFDLAPAFRGLRFGQFHLAADFLQRVPDDTSQTARGQVNVGPLQPNQFAEPHSRCDGQHVERFEPVPFGRGVQQGLACSSVNA